MQVVDQKASPDSYPYQDVDNLLKRIRNLEVQLANQNARINHEGGAAELIVRIESPLVKIYDNTAVISFIRLVNAIPHDGMPSSPSSAWATMVLVKESNEWKIAHHHMSPIGM